MKPTKTTSMIFLLAISFAFALTVFSPKIHSSPAAAPVEKQKILSIGPGEVLVYGENCIQFNDKGGRFRIVTQAKQGSKTVFFHYLNGTRKGPFDTLSDDLVPLCEDSGQPCAAYEEKIADDFDPGSFMESGDNGQYINFSGKKTGPFEQIMQFKISPDKSRFYAVAVDNQKKIWLICSDGRKFNLTGIPGDIILHPAGSLALLRIEGTVDLAKMETNPAAAMTDIDKVFIFTSDGKKLGPFPASEISSGDIWFTKSGTHWLMSVGEKLYIDGNLFRTFSESISKCQFWLSDDGKSWANATYEKLQFSDGTSFAFPLKIELSKSGGTSTMKWISLENNTDIVLYKKAF